VSDSHGKISAEREGDISDFFRDANSYLFSGKKLIPPLRMINKFLEKGLSDLGMGGGAEWQPFALTEDEYFAFVRYIDTPAGQRKFFRTVPAELADPPESVESEDDYRVWEIKFAMTDPGHHFNTTKVHATINGETTIMSLGEALLSNAEQVRYIYPNQSSD
jgi:hypothetical protein